MADYFNSGDWRGKNVLIKHHLPYSDDLNFISNDSVKILVSYRSLPDSVVSWFHHNIRLGKTSIDQKPHWLDTTGRSFAVRALNYRSSWTGKPNTLMVKYEDMLAEPKHAIKMTLEHIGESPSDIKIDLIFQRTRAKVQAGGPLHDGKHIRTGGRSVAKDELPYSFLQELLELQSSYESGVLTPKSIKQFRNRAQ